jgi:hypothetical protein
MDIEATVRRAWVSYLAAYPQPPRGVASSTEFFGVMCEFCGWHQPDFGAIDGHAPKCLRCGHPVSATSSSVREFDDDDKAQPIAALEAERDELMARLRLLVNGVMKCIHDAKRSKGKMTVLDAEK